MAKMLTCDSRCHNSKGKKCECWCGGQYHGLGTKKANELFLKDNYWAEGGEGTILIQRLHAPCVGFVMPKFLPHSVGV